MRASVVLIGRDRGTLELAQSCLAQDPELALGAVASELEVLAGAARPDLVIIDASMHGADWARTVTALRADRRLAATPIVIVIPPLMREVERFLHLAGVAVVSRAALRFDLLARVHALLGPDDDFTQPSTPTARRRTSPGTGLGGGRSGFDLAADRTPPLYQA